MKTVNVGISLSRILLHELLRQPRKCPNEANAKISKSSRNIRRLGLLIHLDPKKYRRITFEIDAENAACIRKYRNNSGFNMNSSL